MRRDVYAPLLDKTARGAKIGVTLERTAGAVGLSLDSPEATEVHAQYSIAHIS